MADATRATLNQFAKYVRKHSTYEFSTDETARAGFTTWFNDVLMRTCADALPYVDNSAPKSLHTTVYRPAWAQYERINQRGCMAFAGRRCGPLPGILP